MRADGSQGFTTAFELIEWLVGVVIGFGWVCGKGYFRWGEGLGYAFWDEKLIYHGMRSGGAWSAFGQKQSLRRFTNTGH
jgi:hypothetical protein